MLIDESRVIERLNIYLAEKNYTINRFANLVSINPGNFHKMLSGKQTITEKSINKIIEKSDINRDWLLTGEGDMLNNDSETTKTDQFVTPYPKQSDYRMVPLINIDSVGGIHSGNIISPDEQYIIKMMPFTEAREGDVAIIQSGNSMYPTIPPGSALLIREVEDWREYFGYGNIYVLLLKDGRRITKEVRRYDSDPHNYVWCVSYNPDVANEELPRSMIRSVWKVIKYIADFGW